MNCTEIKKRLQKLGISQGEAARVGGVTQAQISFFLNGVHKSEKLGGRLEAYVRSMEQKLKAFNE